MTIALQDKWIWDSWYVHADGQWHVWFLQADKSLPDPEMRHFNVTQGHAVSQDLRHWEHQGQSFAPAPSPAFDDYTTWTGSVIQDDDGLWHFFYTGTSRADDGMKQRIGHATSTDLKEWKRVGTGLALDLVEGNGWYEEYTPGHWHDRAMRDPWVMRDPHGDGWLMYFTARVPGIAEPNAGGAIGFAESSDLVNWVLRPPVFSGGFGQLEVPQVFRKADKWYCLFCTQSQHYSKAYEAQYPGEPETGTHYLIADDPRGPWQIAPGRFLDGDNPPRRYAARIVEHDDKLWLMGFLHNPDGADFVGEIDDPQEVRIGTDGLLSRV